MDSTTALDSLNTVVTSDLCDFDFSCFIFGEESLLIHQETVKHSQFNNGLKFLLSNLSMFLPYKKPNISILNSSKIRGHLLLQGSKGPLVSSVSPNFKSGHLGT